MAANPGNIQFDPGSFITSNFLIMKKIFSYLDWVSLKSAREVCRFWAEIIQQIQKLQIQFFYSTIYDEFQYHDWSNIEATKPSHLVFQTACGKRGYANVWNGVLPVWNKHSLLKSAVPRNLHTRLCYDSIPIITTSSQLFFVMPDGQKTDDLKIGGFALPKIQGVSIHMLHILDANSLSLETSPELQNLVNIMDTEIIKCVLFFSEFQFTPEDNDTHELYMRNFLNIINENQEPSHPYSVGGAEHKRWVLHRCTNDFRIIIITKLKQQFKEIDFDCHSQLVESTKFGFDKKIKEMSRDSPRRKYSFTLKLNCFNVSINNEILPLTKYFPSTPILAVPGFNRLLGKNSEGLEITSSNNSTVMIFFSWGKLM